MNEAFGFFFKQDSNSLIVVIFHEQIFFAKWIFHQQEVLLTTFTL